MVNKRIYEKAIEKWGANLQKMMFMEESAELTKLLSKSMRGQFIPPSDIASELADVQIMVEQIQILFNIPDDIFKATKKIKIERLKDRIKWKWPKEDQE